MRHSSALVLADTTVLSNFAHAGGSDLLRQAFPQLGAPRAVRQELAEGERLGRVPPGDWSWLAIIELSETENRKATEFQRFLQAGEAACLAVAESRGGLVLTDDGCARRLAGGLNLQLSGTLGILVRLVHRKTISLEKGDALLVEMVARGYRSPVRSLREIDPLPHDE